MDIIQANKEDLKEILELQYLAFQSEAILINNFSIPPLTQTYEEILEEYEKGVILKAVNDQGIIKGSVRGLLKDNILQIGKLIVHPLCQGQGIGTKLIAAIEEEFPNVRKEIFTSARSNRTIQLYQRNGYCIYQTVKHTPELTLIYLHKN